MYGRSEGLMSQKSTVKSFDYITCLLLLIIPLTSVPAHTSSALIPLLLDIFPQCVQHTRRG